MKRLPLLTSATALGMTMTAQLLGATTASAAPNPTTAEATYCDGWTIASAKHVVHRGGTHTYGAVQLLRNYCHAPGDDYIVWLGRGFLYEDLSGSDYLNVLLQDRFGQWQKCTQYDEGHCTTPPMYRDITGNNAHRTAGTVWDNPATGNNWYAIGETDWK